MSYNTPVRDELVVNLDGIMPELKSSRGIPVVKHTKRGQSENRRLRLDTDLSTLEVFSTNTGYLNRRMSTRTHNLSHLEEVGPATSVPGGLPAVPGRTLLFVFRNRSLFVTVTSRDIGAALVALFRGGPLSHGSPPACTAHPSVAAATPSPAPGRGSEDGIDTSSARKTASASPSSLSSARAYLQTGTRQGRYSTGGTDLSSSRVLDREHRASVGPGARHSGGGGSNNRVRERDEGESDYGGVSGRGRSIAKLKRSASYSAGPDSFADLSSSSSDEDNDDDLGVRTPLRPTPPLSGTSGRSPMSTRSSESPDPIMRTRMVGFGSSDMADDTPKPRLGRSSHSFKARWARRGASENDRKGASAAVSSRQLPSSALSIEGKTATLVGDARGAGHGGAIGSEVSSDRTLSVPVHEVSTATQTALPSPIAVSNIDSTNSISANDPSTLRHPASTPVPAVAPSNELSTAFVARREDANITSTLRAEGGTTAPRTVPSAGRGDSSKPSPAPAASPRHRESSSNTSRENSRPSPSQQQLPVSSPLQKVEEFSFAFPLRQLSPHRIGKAKQSSSYGRKEHKDPAPMTGGERKIPPLPRPLGADGHHWAAGSDVLDAPPTAAVSHDSTEESSVSPLRQSRNFVARENGGGRIRRGRGGQAPSRRRSSARALVDSSSFDSLDEDEGAYGDHESVDSGSTSISEDSQENAETYISASVYGDVRANQRRDAREAADAATEREAREREARERMERDAKSAREAREARVAREAWELREREVRAREAFRARDMHAPATPDRILPRPRNKPRKSADGTCAAPAAASRASKAGNLRSIHGSLPMGGLESAPREAGAGASSSDTRREGAVDDMGPQYGPETAEGIVSKLTIEASSPHDAPGGMGTTMVRHSLPFTSTGPESLASYGSRVTDCTSPDSPPGGAVGEVKAIVPSVPAVQPRRIPLMGRLPIGGGAETQEPKGPSGFEELWAVLEPAWGINASFGTSMAPKVMLLGQIYEAMRGFQAAVASVCVRACGVALGEVCSRCGRAWAVLSSASPQAIAEFPASHNIEKSVRQLIAIVKRYETGAVVRRFTLSLISSDTPVWDEMLSAGEGADLQGPCRVIEDAIALLPTEGRDGEPEGSTGGVGHQGIRGGGGSRRSSGRGSVGGWSPVHLWLPPCPSYWAKGQFDRIAPRGIPDVLALLHEPARFGELARLVTRASDEGPLNRSSSPAWDCVRQAEGPALGRALRRALSATLVDAGEYLPLPRVPPPPPAYLPRERLTEQIEATILHPFLPLGITGIGGPSGSGKTVLAAAVVRDAAVRRRFGDRVFWLHAGKGADKRLISLVQCLADTLYAWLTDSDKESKSGGGGGRASVGANDEEEMREPVRFRDEDQAVQFVADLCQGPRLAGQGLRCLVVLDDVHEQSVVKSLWKSQCQLLVISPVPGLLQAVGAEATSADRFPAADARQVAAEAAGESVLCDKGARLVDLCRGCPLAVAMAGALARAVLHTGAGSGGDWRTREQHSRGGGGGGGGGAESGGRGWSLGGVGNTVSAIAAPVGAWVEQVVGGTAAPNRKDGGGGTAVKSAAEQGRAHRRPSLQSMAWIEVAEKVDMALVALEANKNLRKVMDQSGPQDEKSVRAMQFVLTQVALAEADVILGGSGLATKCYLSFALLPDGFPLPSPALEEFWRPFDPAARGNPRDSATNAFSQTHQLEPGVVQVLEELRLVGRAGGGEGAAGLAPHGLQRELVYAMAKEHKDIMDKLLRRRVWVLSRISSLVGTFDDECWALGGGGDTRGCVSAGGGRDGVVGGTGGSTRETWLQHDHIEPEESDEADSIPAGLLGSGPGPPSHGYGGFSRYDYLVASCEVLPPAHTLTAAASKYLESVRTACRAAQDAGAAGIGTGGVCRWAAARALASAADLQALADRGSEAIPAYEEACGLLAAEAARRAQAGGVSQWQRAARDALHKVASMVQDLALLAGQFRKEAPAIRLLQRAVEIHLSVLASSGALVPDLGSESSLTKSLYEPKRIKGPNLIGSADREVEEAAQLLEVSRGRGAGTAWKAVANDDRPLQLRLCLQSAEGAGEPTPAGRPGGVGSGGTLPVFGRLDVVATCVGDLGRIVSCTRQLRQAKRVDESVQLAEKVYPVLKEILGADHAFTKAALAGFVGQGIVDECWSQKGNLQPNGGSPLGPGQHPTLPSPTSRRKQARTYEGRAGSSGVAGSAEKRTAANSALSALSSPPSPLPQRYYAPSASSVHSSLVTPNVSSGIDHHVRRGGGSYGSDGARQGGNLFSFAAVGGGSDSSGTDGDDFDDDDGFPKGVGTLGAGLVRRGAGRVSRGGHHHLHSKRSLERPLQGWQREAHAAWQRGEAPPPSGSADAGGTGGGGTRGALHPASTLMQHDRYIRHLVRRARAHAFLITAATRARLKDADRAKAGLFLLDRARQASSSALSASAGVEQMPRLTAAWRR